LTTAKKKATSHGDLDLARLRSELLRTAKETKGQLGLYVKHVETGKEVSVEADKVFPLASVFKLGVMVETFRQVEEGSISLDERIELEPKHYCIGEGVLQYMAPGLKPTVGDLLALMIISTDNTASEMLWKRIGIQRVNMMMRELGLAKTSIYIPYRESFLMQLGVGPFKDMTIPEAARKWKGMSHIDRMKALNETERESVGLSIEEFRHRYERTYGSKAEKKFQLQRVYDEVFDNIGTPREIGLLLEKILKNEVVSSKASQRMLKLLMMQKDETAMSYLLSPDIPVALKSGTTAASLTNAAIIFVSSSSHVVLCTFFKKIDESCFEKTLEVEARMARQVYDHFSRVR
jgi:beta-lactamase class A